MKYFKYKIDDLSKVKGGLISLSSFTLVFIGVFIYFYINYDAHSEVGYSLRRQTNVDTGWAPIIVGWGYFLIPIFSLGIFILFKSRDFKQIGLGIGDNDILLNTNLIKSTTISYSEIKEVINTEENIEIKLKDYTKLIDNQFFLFKSVMKNKYIKKDMPITISKADFEAEKGEEAFAFIQAKL